MNSKFNLAIPAIFFFASTICFAQYADSFKDWEDFNSGSISQSQDGPCARITQTWAVEFSTRMHYDKRILRNIDLSELYLWQRCLQTHPDLTHYITTGNTTANNLTPESQVDFIEDYGIVNEACLPAYYANGKTYYDTDALSTNQCLNPCPTIANHYRIRSKMEYSSDGSDINIANNDDMKKAIIQYGPHSVYFTEAPRINGGSSEHSILIVGWDSPDSNQASNKVNWRIKNSSSQYFGGDTSEIGSAIFDLREYGETRISRVLEKPECDGAGCTYLIEKPIDADRDGYCSIKWGEIPAGINCTGHDKDDNDPTIGPYTEFGNRTKLVNVDHSTTYRSGPAEPSTYTTKCKITLAPGFSYSAMEKGGDLKIQISSPNSDCM